MSKMGSHESFGHLQHELWQKERPKVKLAVWLPTIKVNNQPDPSACRWSETHHWKAFNESYKFASDLIPIRGLSKELWMRKVAGIQTETISGLLLGSPGTKSHSNVGAAERRPRVRAVVSPCCPWLVPTPRVIPNVN
jgi:hypothetical protein